jgi:hypothetical protein
MRTFALALVLVAAGCYRLDLGNGQLNCSVPDRKCPRGFHCASDNTCWHDNANPQGPHDHALVSAGVSARSPSYRVVMSLGASTPGGGAGSAQARVHGHTGIVGATQP